MRILPVVAAVTAAFLVVACSSPISLVTSFFGCIVNTINKRRNIFAR